MSPTITPQDVLQFWFDPTHAPRWFDADPAFDALIRERFGAIVRMAAGDGLDAWAATLAGWLALLLVLDQFPRNLYCNDARAWAMDGKAQRIALSGISRGDDRQLPLVQRVFAYLPLEHAEDIALQQRSVALFTGLRAEAPPEEHARFDGFLDYARRHRDVIARFGRFPHRNAALGRDDTPAEARYLAEPGAGF